MVCLSSEIVLVQRITKKQNKFDFSVIDNTILGRKNRVTLSNNFSMRNHKLIFAGIHGYSLDYSGREILKEVGLPSKLTFERVDEKAILVFMCYNAGDSNIIETIEYYKNAHSLGIDMGKKNTFAIVNNFGDKPILIRGTMMPKLYENDKDEFYNSLKKAMEFMQNYSDKNHVEHIYIGNMYKYKPYDIILSHVKKLKNVKVHIVDESNTSKASFLDGDILHGCSDFSGKRITRSQYMSKDGVVFSSDINAAYNILVKGNPFALYNVTSTPIVPEEFDITKI